MIAKYNHSPVVCLEPLAGGGHRGGHCMIGEVAYIFGFWSGSKASNPILCVRFHSLAKSCRCSVNPDRASQRSPVSTKRASSINELHQQYPVAITTLAVTLATAGQSNAYWWTSVRLAQCISVKRIRQLGVAKRHFLLHSFSLIIVIHCGDFLT